MNHLLVLKTIVHKPGYFPLHHSTSEETMFLSMGQKKGLPQFSCILNLLSMLALYIKEADIQHDIS